MGKTYAGVENPYYTELPSTYQQVSYLESDGSQYINTGVIPTANTKVKVACSDFPKTTGIIALLFGSRSSSASNEFEVQYSNNKYYYCFGSDQITYSLAPASSGLLNIDVDGNKCVLTNNNGTETITCSSTALSSSLPMYIFSVNQNGTSLYPCAVKIYSFKIWVSNTLVRNFVPCYRKSDNVAGLYDTVTNTFYTNSGSGSFTVGSNAQPYVAQEANKIYAGVNGIARQVKKAYVGDNNGIARLVYSAEPPKPEPLYLLQTAVNSIDYCTNITGGWTLNGSNEEFKFPGRRAYIKTSYFNYINTKTYINTTGYTKLCLECYSTSLSYNEAWRVRIHNGTWLTLIPDALDKIITLKFAISPDWNNKIIDVQGYVRSGDNRLYSIWLE